MGLFTNLFAPKARNKNRKELVVLTGLARFDVEMIAGKNGQAALEAICGPRVPAGIRRYETAWLIQDDKNPPEVNKVRVEIRGRQVGYLHPETAAEYHKYLEMQGTPDADGQCQALIQGGWVSSDGRRGPYHVSLDFPTYSF
jgi:hypothetical protein